MDEKPVILVVDDDVPILILMQSLLREFGFEPVTAASGNDAVELARGRRPSLVLLDKHMPGMNGQDVIRALRDDVGLAQLPILILSGEPVTKQELGTLRADGAVLKPFDVMALVKQIREHLAM
ncbi:MAG TPA: response regulator [Thermoanaerobaculia bacterium]|nr:response regulator [Thermoanaerobaculia bacterium]